jgi:hypothetical protein
MRWAGHVAQNGEKRNVFRFLVRKPEENRPVENQDVCGWIIIRWVS